MQILVTGAAGFIGFHLCKKLLKSGIDVIGIDNLNNYYDQKLKIDRIDHLKITSRENKTNFNLVEASIEDNNKLFKTFNSTNPEIVVNLAAQAGVRYSIENPNAYIQSNLVGFANVLEQCRIHKVKNLIYASSSSVYGGNSNFPFSEEQGVDHPISLYAATKKSNELMAHTYSHLFGLPATGLRFFTVYGPWGRPDMALFLFTKAILNGEQINIYNNGNMIRDFTFIDDIIESIFRLTRKPATPDPEFDTLNPSPEVSWAPHRIFNIGNSQPTQLMLYIHQIEKCIGKKAIKNFMEIQPGDVQSYTESNTSRLEKWIGFKPNTSIENGIKKFIDWYKDYYQIEI